MASHEESLARYERIVAAIDRGATLSAIAEVEGISRERVRQIRDKGRPLATGRPLGSTKPKRTLYTNATDLLTVFDRIVADVPYGDRDEASLTVGEVNLRAGWYVFRNELRPAIDALRGGVQAEKTASHVRAVASADRRLTPEQRRTRIARAEARAARLRALQDYLDE